MGTFEWGKARMESEVVGQYEGQITGWTGARLARAGRAREGRRPAHR